MNKRFAIFYYSLPWVVIILQQYACWCQIGLTYDSHDYLQAARDLAQVKIPHNANGQLYIERPPLYPLLLSWGGRDQTVYASYLNALSLLLSLEILLFLASKLITSQTPKVLYALSLVMSTPLLMVSVFVWSEAFFLLLMAGHFWAFYYFLEKHKWKYLGLMIIMAFLFCLQRNPGIFFVLGMALSLRWVVSASWIQTLTYAICSGSGWLVWSVYAYSQKGFDYNPAWTSVGQDLAGNFYKHTEAVSAWFLPLAVPWGLRLSLFLLILILMGFIFWKKQADILMWKRKFISSLALIIFLYWGILIFMEAAYYSDISRFEAVIYPFFFLLLVKTLDTMWIKITKPSHKRLLIILLSVYLLYPVVRTLKNAQQWHQRNCLDAEKDS